MSRSPKIVAILGGGISGLSAAYYTRKKFGDAVNVVIFEKSSRVGGWIKSIRKTPTTIGHPVHYECGPRTIRPAGISGMNTLDLIEELGIQHRVLYIQKDHSASKNRLIFHKNQLVRLPTDTSVLFKKLPPFDKPLIFAVLRDILKFRKKMEDDSIYNFIERRFGYDVASYVVDPLIRGVCAGDSRNITVKFLAKELFNNEQKYGSVVLGTLLKNFRKDKLDEDDKSIGFSSVALTSLENNWSVWTLEDGLETLPQALEANLSGPPSNLKSASHNREVTIEKNSAAISMKFGDKREMARGDKIELTYEINGTSKHLHCDYVISTIPGLELARVVRKSKPSHPGFWKVLETIENVDVQVTNVLYDDPDILKQDAFGFLVPSSETLVKGLLGVVFDTCSFPQGNTTILTIMSSPPKDSQFDMKTLQSFLKTTLGIEKKPTDVHDSKLISCIPQYLVGHYEKIDALRVLIKAANIPLILAGSSYDGISVNDSIISGRRAAESITGID